MNIYLIQGDEVFWKAVEIYLKGINVQTFVVDRKEDFKAQEGRRADLIITGRASLDHPAIRTFRVPVILIEEQHAGALPEVSQSRRLRAVLRWPVTKRLLLNTMAEALGLEPRKEFRALIRIGMTRENFDTLAESVDFSLSGMSFTSPAYFNEGLEVVISLSLPGEGGKLILDARVVRSFTDEKDGKRFCGVEFHHLGQDSRNLLKEFVLS